MHGCNEHRKETKDKIDVVNVLTITKDQQRPAGPGKDRIGSTFMPIHDGRRRAEIELVTEGGDLIFHEYMFLSWS
jgi:hypothetical protein